MSMPETTSPSQSTPRGGQITRSQFQASTPILAAIRPEPPSLTLTDHAVAVLVSGRHAQVGPVVHHVPGLNSAQRVSVDVFLPCQHGKRGLLR